MIRIELREDLIKIGYSICQYCECVKPISLFSSNCICKTCTPPRQAMKKERSRYSGLTKQEVEFLASVGMHHCNICNKSYPLSEFYVYNYGKFHKECAKKRSQRCGNSNL